MMKTNALLEKISQYIHHYLDNKKSISYGVLGGDMGCLYYLFQMNKFSLDETDPYKYLSEIIRVLNSTHIVHSYCNGIAGLGYTLNILEKEGLVYNVDNNLSFFDDELFRWYSISLKNEDIDPLHGALGALLYFSIRYEYNPTICRLALKQWGDYLNTHLEKVNNGFTIGFRTFEKTPPYNLSLSHGLSGLIRDIREIAK